MSHLQKNAKALSVFSFLFSERERGEVSDASTFHLDWQVKSAQRRCPDHRRSSFASGTRAPAALLFYYRESSWNEPLPRGGFFTKTGWNQHSRLFSPSIWYSRKTESSISRIPSLSMEYETGELVIAVLSAAPLVGIYQILGWARRPGGVQGSPLTNLYEHESLQISETKSFQVRHILKVHLHKWESEINTFFPNTHRSSGAAVGNPCYLRESKTQKIDSMGGKPSLCQADAQQAVATLVRE